MGQITSDYDLTGWIIGPILLGEPVIVEGKYTWDHEGLPTGEFTPTDATAAIAATTIPDQLTELTEQLSSMGEVLDALLIDALGGFE